VRKTGDPHRAARVDGTVYAVTRYRDTSVNLRTQLTKIIKRTL
jgi:hypothetical protein